MTKPSQSTETVACPDEVFLGDSPVVRRLRLQIPRIAPYFRIALLIGEAGTGKYAVARRLHSLSPAAGRRFTVIPCTDFALQSRTPDEGATLYLPGLESLPSTLQGRLLRALKFLRRDNRVIVAGQFDVKGLVSAGKIRSDLYRAVGDVELRLAPLRERVEDLELIATAMVRRHRRDAGFDPTALTLLRAHTWPGNLDELRSLCEKLRGSSVIVADDLPRLGPPAPPASTQRLEDVMHRHVLDVLQTCSGNKLRAAELLGISRSTLYRMLECQTSRTPGAPFIAV
jgi:DNA-binding NtrC family response regulator